MRLSLDTTQSRRVRGLLCAALLAVVAVPGLEWFATRADASASALPQASDPARWSVKAVGRLEPRDGLLPVAAPDLEASPAIVAVLHVSQGDWVTQGQLLAELQGRAELQALRVARERQAAVARARLEALQAGGKPDDIRALQAEIQSDEAALAQIEADTKRSKQLRAEGIISAAAMESQNARLTAAARALDAKRARLSSLSTTRPADISVAEAELRAAQADIDQARLREDRTLVRSPAEGRILAVHAYPGQRVGAEGIVTLGKTREMLVDAEVAEEDLPRIREGQRAIVTGDALASPASGTVEKIGYLVGSREVFRADPAAFSDSRIVHVKIRAEDPASLERFINARVTVEIRP